MNQIPISKLKLMKVADWQAAMPFQVISDGSIVGVVSVASANPPAVAIPPRTKCPNCKFEYDAVLPDGKPPYFTIRH